MDNVFLQHPCTDYAPRNIKTTKCFVMLCHQKPTKMANFSAVFSLLQADLDSEDHDEDSGGSEIELIQVNCGKKTWKNW